MKYAQLVMGPAGSGKSTYCSAISKYCEDDRHPVKVVNLDPAAEIFDYQPYADIRELIHVDDAMEDEDLHYGPNGGLVFCMEFLIENFEWLEEKLDVDDDYVLFDCPGQIELYTHLDIMQHLVENLRRIEFNICGVYLIDSKFMVEPTMFMSGVLTALSAMVSLELPHINVLSKMDLLSTQNRQQIERFLEADVYRLLCEDNSSALSRKWHKKFRKLNEAIAEVVDNFSIVKFLPLDKNDLESISNLLLVIDNAIQYGEDQDVKVRYPEQDDDEFFND